MLREFFEFVMKKAEPHIVTHEGTEYSDKPLYPIEAMQHRPERDVLPISPLDTNTLTSIVDFIRCEVDEETEFPMFRKIIHIVSPNEVILTSELKGTGNRQTRIRATCHTLKYPFNQFLDREMFNIQLQTQFENDENLTNILTFIGSMADGTVTEGDDDGITQQVTVRKGIQRKCAYNVPNPVTLTPRRTFPEVEQPDSPFVFRLRSAKYEGDMPTCALYESDGEFWKVQAIDNIAEWFVNNLDENSIESGDIVIIR